MKIGKYIVIVLMLVTAPLLGAQVFAHPPQDMTLTYNIDTITLDVTITHQVINPNDHYIYKVDIKKNDVLILTENYGSQPSTSTFTYSYSVDANVGDQLKVTAYCSIAGSITRQITVSENGDNLPPNAPIINGETKGKAGIEYEYTFLSIDPEGDDINYIIDWCSCGDTITIGPYLSGEEAKATYIWDEQGTYIIKAKAKDIHGAESDWATLEVSVPKNKAINTPFLSFLENHPYLFPLLRQLLELK